MISLYLIFCYLYYYVENLSPIPDGTFDLLCKRLLSKNELKPFIMRFASTTRLVSQAMEIIKSQGLGQTSHEQCRRLSEQLPKNSKSDFHRQFTKGLKYNPADEYLQDEGPLS